MKRPQRQRLLLFLVICLLTCLGSALMGFGDTRLATSAGGILTGMGVMINILQLFFKLPLEIFSKRGSNLITQQSVTSSEIKLILPPSYYEHLRKQQEARRESILRILFSIGSTLLLLLPLVAVGYGILQFPNTNKTSCIIVTKQIGQGSLQGTYGLDFTVQVKAFQNSTSTAFYPAEYQTLQSAQKELDRFIIGRSYACLVLPAQGYAGVTSSNDIELESDRPLSSASGVVEYALMCSFSVFSLLPNINLWEKRYL